MATRRQEKIARVVKEAVSDAIANHLNDPRLEGAFVSVTRVEVSADLRIANVYLSMFGGVESSQNKAFAAIMHAKKWIQMLLADRVKSRFCPVLNIHKDEKFKKALETMKMIDDLAGESNPSNIPETNDEDSIDQEHD